MAIGQQLSRGTDDGVCLGQSSTDKIGFYGLATPVVQPSVSAASVVAKTTTTTSTTTALTADVDSLRTMVLSLRTALTGLGLVA